MTRCECCDLPVTSCGKAAEGRQRAEARAERERLARLGAFVAVWPGHCVRCGEPFQAGDLILSSGLPIPTGFGYLAGCCA